MEQTTALTCKKRAQPASPAQVAFGLLAFILIANVVLGFPAAGNLAFLAPVSIATYRGGLRQGLPVFLLTTITSTMVLAYSGQIQHGGLVTNVLIEAMLLTGAMIVTDKTRQNLHDTIDKTKTDALTGAQNRASIADLGNLEVNRAMAQGLPMAVAVIDLDHFKELNDGHGHAFGDAVLKDLVKTLSGHLSPTDVVGRTGGDEFVVLMPNRTLEESEQLLRRANNAFCDRTLVEGHPISFSYGVGCPGRDGFSWATLLDAADQDMYRRKSAKKNRQVARQAS